MSKQCPYCKSYNTELSPQNIAAGGVKKGAKFAIAAGLGALAAAIFPVAGPPVAVIAYKNLKSQDDSTPYHCCNCGKDF